MAQANDPFRDEDLGPGGPTVVEAIKSLRVEAEEARRTRIDNNRINRDVYLGRQDWSHKQDGQSREFLPKVPVSVEQMATFVKRGLIQFGPWFSVKTDRSLEGILDGRQVSAILNCFLGHLWAPGNQSQALETLLSDGVKNGLLESLMIYKVHGGMYQNRRLVAEPGQLAVGPDGSLERGEATPRFEETEEWRLRVDLVRPEDYYPDPTGNGLYEIHRVERDLHEVLRAAEDGLYNRQTVQQLIDIDYKRPEDEARSDRDRNQDQPLPRPSFRKRVVIDEFWGTLLSSDGTVAHRNVVAAVANDRYLIRPPEPNPFWHQESPFIVQPLIRVPWSVWHKALYDDASRLNLAINELFNLMLDGGMASVWGIKQIRLDDLEDPKQVSGGVQQGSTLAVKGTLPHGQHVLEDVSTGQLPNDAMAMFEFINREFTQAALTNELKLGSLPAKEVRATEIIESNQSQAITLEGIVSDLEVALIAPLLRKAWLTILQNMDQLPDDVLMGKLDRRTAVMLVRASALERYQLLAGRCKFTVNGLSATLARARDFQKMMALFQAVNVNPMLMNAFMRRFSPERALTSMIKMLQFNPEDLEKTPEELEQFDQELAQTAQMQQLMNPTKGGEQGGMGGNAGQPGMQSAVNQELRPVTGMAPNS